MAVTFKDFHFPDIIAANDEFILMDAVVLPKLLTPAKVGELLQTVVRADKCVRRDLMMPNFGDNLPPDVEATPRHMVTISGLELNRIRCLRELYKDPDLLRTLSVIVGWPGLHNEEYGFGVEPCRDELENMVVTRLEKAGDTHGFHLDVPQIAFVICLEAPKSGGGGEVEYMGCSIRGYRAKLDFALEPGDAYILNAADALHRVKPLHADAGPRTILNFTYVRPGTVKTANGSANLLFG